MKVVFHLFLSALIVLGVIYAFSLIPNAPEPNVGSHYVAPHHNSALDYAGPIDSSASTEDRDFCTAVYLRVTYDKVSDLSVADLKDYRKCAEKYRMPE